MKVSFILLAHEAPDQLRELICSLLASGSDIYVHHDLSSNHDLEQTAQGWQLEQYNGSLYFAERTRVVWGEWSIIQATLNCLKVVKEQGYSSDYYMLISGSCMPVTPIAALESYLRRSGRDHIETVNALKNRWVTSGLQEERWDKYHVFNWRYQQKRFDLSLKVQRLLGIKRSLPLGHVAHMGSQWWCLRNSTLKEIDALLEHSPELLEFYRRTWIPDELFFQTLVANLIAPEEVDDQLLTRYRFNSWGVPRVYYEDDYPELLAEELFFVRKVSHRANALRSKLANIAPMSMDEYQTLLAEARDEKASLIERTVLESRCTATSWYNLASSEEREADLFKSIPNPFVIVVSRQASVKSEMLSLLAGHRTTLVYGDLFSEVSVGEGYTSSTFLPVGTSDTVLARHRWAHLLADIAFANPDKTIVFSMGDECLDFIENMQGKHNLHVLIADDEPGAASAPVSDFRLQSTVFRAFHDVPSQVAMLPAQRYVSVYEQYAAHQTLNSFLQAVSNVTLDYGWPSLSASDDHYEAVKDLTAPLVVLVGDISQERSVAVDFTKLDATGVYLDGLLSVLKCAKKIKPTAHFMVADVIHQAHADLGAQVIYTTLGLADVELLDVLRWSSKVLVINALDRSSLNQIDQRFNYRVEGSLSDLNAITAMNKNLVHLDRLMMDRYCSYFEQALADQSGILSSIELFKQKHGL